MKHLFIIIIAEFLISFNICAQCLPGPDMNFSGTKIAWSYEVEDPLMDQTICLLEIYAHQQSALWVDPIEYDDKYICVFGNGVGGTIINAVDKNTGNIIWQKIYNHTNTEETRGFNCPFVKKLNGDSLELLGFRTYYSYEPTKYLLNSGRSGFPNRIVISHKTGKQLDYYSIQGYNNLDRVALGVTPKQIKGENIYYSFSLFTSNSDSITAQLMHVYVDSKTLKRYYNWAPWNELEGKAAPSISFNHIEPNGNRPEYYYVIAKIFPLQTNINGIIYNYFINGKTKHHLLKLDDWGYQISDIDITDQIASSGGIVYHDDAEIIDGNKIRIQCRVPKAGFHEYGHHGYVEIDFDGNLIKDNKEMVIDGYRPIFLKTIELENSDDILHIFRPQENNNIYFYKERPDGSYIKAGELINNNRSVYAFKPVLASQANDGDLFVGFQVLLDSLVVGTNAFNTGGWGNMIKIEAEELGITVGTKDELLKEEVSVFPNPTTNNFRIKAKADYWPLNVQLFDITGKMVSMIKMEDDNEISLENIPNGIYLIKIQSSIKNSVPIMSKIVKLE